MKMYAIKRTLAAATCCFAMVFCGHADIVVSAVTAQQRNPWSGPIDIALTMQGSSNDVADAVCLFFATNSATKAAIQVAHITQNGDVTGSGTSWTRKFIWDAKADVGEVKINDLALTVGVCKPSGIQLWEDGPYWAECNVGATKPEEYGYYFCWGDTVGYKRNANDDGWVSVEDGRDYSSGGVDCPTFGKSCSELESSGYIDSTGNLVARYDAATEYLGAQWRMPSDAEFSDLISKCATTWTESNGVNGLLVTGKGVFASKRIFLPASGPYWSSTPHPSESSCSWCLSFASFHVDRGFLSRYFVQSVRPVCKLDGAGAADDAASTHLSIDYTRHARIALLGVTALQQDAPNGLVDIFVSIQGSSNDVARAVWTFVATNSATKAAIQVAHITQNGDVTGEGTVWTRKFIWDAKADAGEVKIEDVALTAVVELPFGGVQLWENGPYWSECNVGAATPEEYGYYFWWGDTVGYKRNSTNSGWESVKDGMPFSFSPGYCPTCAKSGYNLQLMGYIDSTGKLTTEHDAATQHCGAPWRMPTDVELDALTSNCDMTWTTRNGVYGYNVKGKGIFSTNNIFFPVAGYGYNTNISRAGGSYGRGYYWSSTPYSSDVACVLLFDSGNFNSNSKESRDCGQPVRPVREFGSASASVDTATTHLSIDCTPVVGIDLPCVTALQQGAANGSVDIVVTMSGASNDVADAVCLFFATNSATKAAIQVAHITLNGDVAGEGTIWTRKFVWDAKADVGSVKIEDVELTVRIEDQRGGVQLWENGPYWAESNVGATKPEEYGYYFWWGDTVGYERDGNNWNAVDGTKTGFSFDSGNSPTYGMSNSQLESEGYIDATGNLVAVNDAATAHLGAPWRMPTDAEFSALTKNCDREWTSRNGVFGQLVKGRGKYVSRSIFIPAAGQGDGTDLTSAGSYGNYWSSTPDFDNSNYAYYLRFYNGGFSRYLGYGRYNGRPVRPIRSVVCEISGSTTTHLSLDYEDQALPQGGPYTETVNGVEWTFMVDGDLKASVGGGSYDSGAVPLGTAGEISIPVMLGGRPVANIGSYAFHCRGGLTSVSIPNGVTNIGSFAFQGTGLTDVSIPTSVLHIGEDAFCGTPLMSSDNLFDLSVVDGWLLGYKYCTRPISPDEQPYEIPRARQTGGIVVPDGVRHIADGALREASGNSGDGIWGWTIDFSALTLPTGLETIGANAFGYGSANEGSKVEIRIPASVVRIGSTLFSRCKNLKVVFEGDRPEAADDSFCDADVYWGDDETQPFVVYYMDSRSGWSNGELWAGAITFSSDELPDDVRIDSPIRFADCPYWGFRFEGQMKGVPYKQEDCELKRGRTVAVITKRGRLDTYQPTNGSFFAIPVTGVSAKTEVQPVFTWATANQNMIADCQVLTDEEFRQLVSGDVSESTGWEKDDDDPDEVWLLQDFGTMTSHSREWPKGLWPNGASDGSRYWIYVRVNNLGYLDSELWSGDYTFRVGLGGTSEWTEPLHITFDTATIHSPSDMWSNVVFSGITGWSAEDLHQDVFEGLTFFGLGLFSGSFPFEAEVEVPSAGILYLYSGEGDDISDETLSVTSCAQINSETIQFGGGGQGIDSWYPLENFCAYAGCGSLRTINVGSEATLSLKMKDTYQPKLELMRVQFFPAGKKSAAVEASFASVIKSPYKKWDFETYLQGKVTGTGIYSSGETVRLIATPGPGEAFDHWEVLLGEVPSGTNLLSPTLEFVMTDDVAGTPEERKQIIVRAVWREKCAVTALPVEAGTAVIDGSGLYFNGETVEFRVKPAEGYEFVKWLDGSTENPRTVSALSGGGDRVYYAVVEKADDGPDPDGGPYEGVVDGDTWLYSFKLSHMSEAFGAVCSLQDGEVEVGPGGRETDKWAVSPAPTGAVAVPQEVDGYSVVALGCSAFEDSELTSVSLPDTIRYLGGWCLSGCKKLESVSLPDSVVLVGDKAFDGCTKLKSVQLSRNLEYISWHAFDGCASLTSICLPGSVKAIGEDAFVDCDALTSVSFEGAPPVGVLSASIKQDAEIRYNMLYEEEWLPVIASAGWSNAKGYLPSQYVVVLNETNYCTSLDAAFQGLTSGENTIRLLDNTSSGWVKIEEGACVALDLNGFTLRAECEEGKSLFEVSGAMTVEDSRGGGCIVGEAYSDTSGGAFNIYGVLTLNGGTISNFNAKVGGCAYVWQGGKLVIEDGVEISKCSSSEGGGGLYVRGEFDFNGGLVSDCSSAKEGGGIKVEKTGVLNMAGGLVTGCTGVGAGGVFNRGVFLMTGGELSGNTATRSDYPDAVIVGNDLFMEYGDVSVTINDGSVKSSIGYHSSYLDGYKAKTFLQGGLYGDRPFDDFVTSGYAVKAVVDPDLLDAGWGYSVAVDEKTLSDLLVGCRDVASSGAAEWFTKQMDGEWVLQSGAIADRQASTLSCKVDGAGVLTFKWKVSSDCFEDYQDDYLNVEVDGQEVAWIAGEKGWLEQRIELAARDKPHEVKWNYSKDKSDAAGCDCGWLKDVVWTPEAVCHVTVSSLYGEPTGGGEYACGTTVVLDAPLLPMPSQAGEGWFICRGSSGSPVLTNHIEFVATCDTNIVWDVWQTNWFVWCDAAFSASEYADVAVKITPPTESLEAALGIEPVNGGSAPFGSIVEINVALKPGYIVSSWQGAPEARPNDTNVTLVVTGDRTFTPVFSEGAYLPSDRTGGKVIAIDEWVAMDEMSFLYGDMFWWRFTQNYGNDFTSAILLPNGKKRADGTPMEVWEDFVAGTDPTDLGSKFTSKIEIVNGKPVISWDPELTPEQAARRVYTTYGCSELGGEWYNADEAPAEVKSQLRFFKVGVEMK